MVESTDVIVAISLAGAIGQALVTMRWYEPPARDDRDDHEPSPALEAAIFFVAFGLAFALVGYALAAVANAAPPYSGLALVVLTPLGLVGAYATATGRLDADADRATTILRSVACVVVGAYPIALLLV